MGDGRPKPRIRRRRIIERPRLIRALDRSKARVRMLVAGPGYGKTILAEQWAPRDERVVRWFRARRSAADVAVVARALVAATADVLPGAGRRLLERLAVTEDPEREAAVLAEMLAEDLDDWPETAWVVIDDYHHVAVSVASETFVETVVNRSPIRMLLASRVRPSWVPGRSILYGDVLEIPQTALAMSEEEAEEVLRGSREDLTSGLLALAGGWPAVIGLAGMAPEASDIDADLPETLYEFFADELYRGLEPTIRTGLAMLAAMPTVDHELAAILLGPARAARVCDEALSLGILDERDGRLELHPLASAFLERRTDSDVASDLRESARRGLALYRGRREWDSSFEVIKRFAFDDELPSLLLVALDEYMYGARLVALEEWIQHARSRGLDDPVFAAVEAELHLRHGRHLTALTVARSAIDRGTSHGEVAYRLLIAAARAAHVGSQEAEALDLYERAHRVGASLADRREALWGQVMCHAALERDEARALLHALEQTAVASDPRDQVRMADKRLSVGFRFGYVRHLPDSRRASELVTQVDDPLIRCSFRSMHSWALVLGAHYDEALSEAGMLLTDATEYRVDPALPYGHATAAAALAGLHRYPEALRHLAEARLYARRFNDENGWQNAYAIGVRVLLQSGDIAEACAVEPPELSAALPSMRGEVLGSRALALASLGRVDEALDLAHVVTKTTSGIEANALSPAVHAVCSVKSRHREVVDVCTEFLAHCFSVGAVDIAVTAYRANRGVLSAILASSRARDQAVFLTRRAADEALLNELGASSAALLDPAMRLSNREREVYGLVCEGLSNPEIARRLFITEATVKAHVRHVFDKLGIRSRTALALNAAKAHYAAPSAGSESGTPSASDTKSESSGPNSDPRA